MILHIKSHMTNFKHSVPATYEGIKSLFSMFPFVEEIVAHHHNFQEALNEIVDYLSSHHMEAWVSQEPQKNNKGLNELLKIIDEAAKEHGLDWYKPQSAEPIKKSSPLDPLIQQAKANIAMVNKVAAQNPRPMLFGNKKGTQHGFVSVDPSKPNQWRITHFIKGEPSGHTEAVSFSDAVKKAHSSGYDVSKELSEEDMYKTEDLEKGARGDWEKEGGYSLHVSSDVHEPQAVIIHKGKKIGGLNTIKTPDGVKVSMVYIDPEHQRKGLATAMYQAIEDKIKTKLIPSDKQTTEGKALWSQPNRQFGKSETDNSPHVQGLEDYLKEQDAFWEKYDKAISQEPRSMVFANEDNTRHGFVTPDPSNKGGWRVTHFVKGALRGHTEVRNFKQAIEEAHAHNYDIFNEIPEEEVFKSQLNKSEDFSRVSSVIVATDDKMLMLQRRDNNKWTFPGGHLNDTETHLEGAVRELWEEAGIRANPDEMILLGNKKTHENKDIHVYLYKVDSEIKPSADNDPDKEAKKFEWLPHVLPEEIKNNLYIPIGDNASLSMFSVWILRQKTNKLKELVEAKKSV